MKYTLLYLTLVCFIFGCKGMYKDEENGVMASDTTISRAYSRLEPDSVYTITINSSDCLFKVKKPYHLIQWNDKSYGILKKDEGNWYLIKSKTSLADFTYSIKNGSHFEDSCAAKKRLQECFEEKITYKIVK